MIIKFSDSVIKKHPELFKHVATKYFKSLVYYIIDSKYRKSVKVMKWLKSQVNSPTEKLLLLEQSIPNSDKDDIQIMHILRYIKQKFKYVKDSKTWKMSEYWQTANQSAELMTGDCEDGAILMYVIARLKGIDPEKLVIFAGDVVGGGHAFLGYRPDNYPLNWAILDWCYWYKRTSINNRNLFYIKNNLFAEYKYDKQRGWKQVESCYLKMWFAFNENTSNRSFLVRK